MTLLSWKIQLCWVNSDLPRSTSGCAFDPRCTPSPGFSFGNHVPESSKKKPAVGRVKILLVAFTSAFQQQCLGNEILILGKYDLKTELRVAFIFSTILPLTLVEDLKSGLQFWEPAQDLSPCFSEWALQLSVLTGSPHSPR